MSRLLAMLLAGAALMVAGCGTKTIDQQSEVNLVKLGLQKANAGAPKSVDCPSGVEAKVNKTFECHAVLADGTTKATFTLRVDRVSGSTAHLSIAGARKG